MSRETGFITRETGVKNRVMSFKNRFLIFISRVIFFISCMFSGVFGNMLAAFGVSKKSYLMLEFARLHFPDALAETENRYNGVYAKRHERITERLEALKNGVQEVA
jgi:hypothetical protein